MDNSNYYYKSMATYLSKRNWDESFMRYFFGKNSPKKTPEELEKADERKRRLQRERSRRYRALKNARRQHESTGKDAGESRSEPARVRVRPPPADADETEDSDVDHPPTLCHPIYECVSDESSAHSSTEMKEAPRTPGDLKDLLSTPGDDLDYSTVHSLMFHWLQT